MEKKDVKMYCKLKDKEVNIRYSTINSGIVNIKNKECSNNRIGRPECKYANNPECLLKSI